MTRPLESRSAVKHLLGRSVFPAPYAWFLEGRWRRWVLSPEQLATRLPLRADLTACEIGVGGGYYARHLTNAVRRLIGLDLQQAMLHRVQGQGAAPNLLLVQGDATALPLADASIDLLIAVTVLGEVPSADAAIAEAGRVLRPDGVLSVSEHLPDPDFVPFKRLERICTSRGFACEARFGRTWCYTANFRAPHAA